MKSINFENYKFRASQVGKLLTNPRNKSEVLSETAKSYLREIFIEEIFGRKKEIANKFIEKGLLMEEDSIDLVSKLFNKIFIKNKETLENSLITGTPDIIPTSSDLSNYIIEIKTSWDIFTFFEADGENPDYIAQCQAYMHLTGRTRAKLIYCLIDAPIHMVQENIRFKAINILKPLGLEYSEIAMIANILAQDEEENAKEIIQQQIVDPLIIEELFKAKNETIKAMTYKDIPDSLRIRIFEYEKDANFEAILEEKIKASRQYLSDLFKQLKNYESKQI